MKKTPPAGRESGTTGRGEEVRGGGGGDEGGGDGEGEMGKKRYCLTLHSQTTVSVDLD